jgi:hypothetical protein
VNNCKEFKIINRIAETTIQFLLVDGEHGPRNLWHDSQLEIGIGRFGGGSRQLLTKIYKISIVYNVKI